jgi:hypothetical protein
VTQLRYTELWGGPKDGMQVIDDGRMHYDVLLTEPMDLRASTATDLPTMPSYSRGTYTRHIRARDRKPLYVWQGINIR